MHKNIGNRIQVAYKQPKNLQQLVGGCEKGSKPIPPDVECNTCTKDLQRQDLQDKAEVNCNSEWVIYLCSCKKCGGQYVGIKLRHSNHKREIKNKIGGSGGCGYESISIVIIEEIEEKTFKFLAERESFWQHQLRVFVENGKNCHCYRKEV